MFFADRIRAIRPADRVLEIGPGSTPHPRGNEFLEWTFGSRDEQVAQRGAVAADPCFGGRPVHYYNGSRFPFPDGRFDYVICSHVIEHVDDPAAFAAEIFRVGGTRGYLEYPLITYEYLYDFATHRHFMKFDASSGVLKFLPKAETSLAEFRGVCALFRNMLIGRWDDLCAANKPLFFEGFEYDRPFAVQRASCLEELLPDPALVAAKGRIRRLLTGACNWLGW